MDPRTKKSAVERIWKELKSFHEDYLEVVDAMKARAQEGIDELEAIAAQLPLGKPCPLVYKTPKASRVRIETIPEDEVVNQSTIKRKLEMDKCDDTDEELPPRSRRAASIKANKNIKKQQSISLNTKLRRPSATETVTEEIMPIRASRTKRPKISYSGSDEDDSKRPAKQSKTENTQSKHVRTSIIKLEPNSKSPLENRINDDADPIQLSKQLPPERSIKSIEKSAVSNIINETLPDHDTTLTEQSLYEDAIGKSIPMNSTMNPNTTVTIDRKMLNVTVVLEKMNETRTISKNSLSTHSTDSTKQSIRTVSEQLLAPVIESDLKIKNDVQIQNNPLIVSNMINNQIDDLITDDESSPDRVSEKITQKTEKLPVKKRKRVRENIVDDSDEDVIMASPMNILKPPSTVKRQNDLKYKSSALFSPYTKDSVKKRVEAFEQVRIGSPKVTVESSGRITRTKTRAMAANNDESVKTPTVANKLARKSLAKAKKISLAKQKREYEEEKENAMIDSSEKSNKYQLKHDKLVSKLQQQLRTTPVSKSRLQMPMSVSRIPQTPIVSQLLPSSKAMTASRAYNMSSTESLASFKPLSKSNSTDSLVEKKNKVIHLNDEDARRKKEEALKAQTDEKRRKREEKELKNKLAREAKEKLEQEKRLKQEKEREEKARHALMVQEKLREEAEKKKLVQLQRAHEKEERRKQEELLKLQRLQEQEETERLLAEQKRREQEAERRRMAETRAQQLAAAEAARLKQQYQAKAKLLQQQKQQIQLAPTSYKIDSDPDDDESDNESQPKHTIPHWAKSEIRKTQLEMQQFIPMDCVLKFFGAKKCTPDLSELFVGIKKDRLKRTSSAIWKTPPRFSMMEDE